MKTKEWFDERVCEAYILLDGPSGETTMDEAEHFCELLEAAGEGFTPLDKVDPEIWNHCVDKLAGHVRVNCPDCAMTTINGVPCHEQGCPSAWKGQRYECFECGCTFTPDEKPGRHPYCEDCKNEKEMHTW